MEEILFYERLCFQVLIVTVKDKKYSIKNAMSMKINFDVFREGVSSDVTNCLKLRGAWTSV